MELNITLYQYPLGSFITKDIQNQLKKTNSHFVCFPEYFFVNKKIGNHNQTIHNQMLQEKRIKILSHKLNTVIIGGSMPEIENNKLYNTSFVYHNGKKLGSYRKQNLFFAEVGKITPGNKIQIFEAYNIKFSVLICADVFIDDYFLMLKEHNVKIIFIPTFSLIKNETIEEKFKRDNDIFVRAAKLSSSIIVKVCGVKSNFKNFLQARSLIASPEGIIYRVAPDEEDKSMIITKTIEI